MRKRYENGTAMAETGELGRVCLTFEEWRRHHKPPTPIPLDLWAKAVELAGRFGVGRTARALRLDYGALKRRVAAGRMPVHPAPAEFIELLSPMTAGIAECALEVESPRGGRMRVVMKHVAPQGLASILRDFVS